ncbi:MAG: peptidyl-tRNA hydrolase Pth2 [Thermoplasmatales archaeon]
MKLAVAVRKDLDMGRGKIAVQVAHAAVECTLKQSSKRETWIKEGQKKIVVWVKNEDELLELIKKAEIMGIRTCPIRDAGFTQVEPNTLTCAGFGPDEDSLIDSITGNLKLV